MVGSCYQRRVNVVAPKFFFAQSAADRRRLRTSLVGFFEIGTNFQSDKIRLRMLYENLAVFRMVFKCHLESMYLLASFKK